MSVSPYSPGTTRGIPLSMPENNNQINEPNFSDSSSSDKAMDMPSNETTDNNESGPAKRKRFSKSTFTLAVVMPLIIIAILVLAVFLIKNIFHTVTLDSSVSQEDIDNYIDSYDVLIPLTDENGYLVRQDVKKILIFGNYPFASDADSESGMAALLAGATGAEIINCSIAGTKIGCSSSDMPSKSNPMDIYTPYYLTALMSFKDAIYDEFVACGTILGDKRPANADAVVKTLYEIDPSDIDVFVFMYDSEDYWSDQRCFDFNNEYSIDTVCGNIISAFRMIKLEHTNNRIIFMSPYFNLYENEDGSTETCEFHSCTHGTPSTYFFQVGDAVNKTTDASFIDNLYGSITEDNYKPYLSGTRELTQAGREKLIDRLVYAICYYDKKE